MPVQFNADEVFEMAQRIERNGAAFYRRAAQNAAASAKQFLLELADWEDRHEKIFARLRTQYARKGVFSPQTDEDAQPYLQTIADGRVFNVSGDPSRELTGKESLPDVLRRAIDLEKDSIIFYIGMRDMVPGAARDEIEGIIREEMRHISVLAREMSSGGKGLE